MVRRFHKMHGLGNDFVVLDGREHPVSLDASRARAIADRRTGIGCDQLILLEPSIVADIRMRIFNADGSEVQSCGNAARCVTLLEGGVQRIETLGGIIAGVTNGTGASVDMGCPRFGWDEIPLAYAMDTREMPVGWEVESEKPRAKSDKVAALNVAQRTAGAIQTLLDCARRPGHNHLLVTLGDVSDGLTMLAARRGVDLAGVRHVMDTSGIRHVLNTHGDAEKEARRGNVAIVPDDLKAVPDLLAAPDYVIFGLKTKRGQSIAAYVKALANGTTVYLEEHFEARKRLALKTMWKVPGTIDASRLRATLNLNARSASQDIIDIVEVPRGFKAIEPLAAVGTQRLDGPFAVNVGNPHVVFFVDDAKAVDLERLGPLIENDPLFPERINVNAASAEDGAIRLRVWERGAGLTQACGTGACATAVAAISLGRARSPVEVRLPGGTLNIAWERGGRIQMSGPAAHVFTGEIDLEALA